MKRVVIGFMLLVSNLVWAQEKTVRAADLIQGNARRMSLEDVKSLIKVGTQVLQIPGTGRSERRWTNQENGTFLASIAGAGVGTTTGQGKWEVKEDGTFCIDVAWSFSGPGKSENWCRAVYEMKGALYLAPIDLEKNRDKSYGLVEFKN